MQLGHILIGLLLATFDWNLKSVILILFFSLLPNIDVVFVRLGLMKEENHCCNSFTHSLLFAVAISLFVLIFSLKYAIFAFIAIVMHLIIDIPTDTGITLFYPFSRKRYSLNLWKNTGSDFKGTIGYYKQKWPLILEGIILILLLIFLII